MEIIGPIWEQLFLDEVSSGANSFPGVANKLRARAYLRTAQRQNHAPALQHKHLMAAVKTWPLDPELLKPWVLDVSSRHLYHSAFKRIRPR
jgi:hypothetical protein